MLERPPSTSRVVPGTCCPVSKLATVWNEPPPNSFQYSTSYRWRSKGHLAPPRHFLGPVAFPAPAIWASEAIWPSRVQSESDKSWAVKKFSVYITSHFLVLFHGASYGSVLVQEAMFDTPKVFYVFFRRLLKNVKMVNIWVMNLANWHGKRFQMKGGWGKVFQETKNLAACCCRPQKIDKVGFYIC